MIDPGRENPSKTEMGQVAGPFVWELQSVSCVFRRRQSLFGGGEAFKALDGIHLSIPGGSSLAVVGESGSGKTTFARMLSGLLRPSTGKIFYKNRPLDEILRKDSKTFRGAVQMIFQNPYLSLDPRWKIRRTLEEGIRHLPAGEKEKRIAEALRLTRLDEVFLDRTPSMLSGGERQRVALARALVMRPQYMILDEPTAALDAITQKEIIAFLRGFRESFRDGLLLVTHDLALASQVAEEIIVLRQGKIIECGKKREVLSNPSNAYTRRLLEALPKLPRMNCGTGRDSI